MPQARHPSLFRQLPAPLTVRCNDLFCALANPTGPRHSAGVHLPRHYARLRTRGRRPLYQIQFGMAAIAYSLVTAGNVWLLPDHATWLQSPYVRVATVVAGIVALLIFFRLDYEPRLWRLYLKDRVIVTPGTYRHPTFVALAYFLIDRGGILVSMAGLYGHFTNYINEGTREAALPYLFAIVGCLFGPLLIAPLIRSHFMTPDKMTPKKPIPYTGISQYVDRGD